MGGGRGDGQTGFCCGGDICLNILIIFGLFRYFRPLCEPLESYGSELVPLSSLFSSF